MDFERSEHEPEEYDPEEDLHDPDSDGLTIPSAPEIDPGSGDVPSEVSVGFWLIVVTLKVAILATSAGILLVAFGYQTRLGLVGLVGGLVLFAFAGRRYRKVKRTLSESEEAGDDDAKGDGPAHGEVEP